MKTLNQASIESLSYKRYKINRMEFPNLEEDSSGLEEFLSSKLQAWGLNREDLLTVDGKLLELAVTEDAYYLYAIKRD